MFHNRTNILVSDCGLIFRLSPGKIGGKLPIKHEVVRKILFPDLVSEYTDGVCSIIMTPKGNMFYSIEYNNPKLQGMVCGKMMDMHQVFTFEDFL